MLKEQSDISNHNRICMCPNMWLNKCNHVKIHFSPVPEAKCWGSYKEKQKNPVRPLRQEDTASPQWCSSSLYPSILLSLCPFIYIFSSNFFLVKISIIFIFQFLKFKTSPLFPLNHWVLAKHVHVPGCTVGFGRCWEITRQHSNLKRRLLGLRCEGLRYQSSLPPFAFFNNCLSPSQEGSLFSLPPS